MVRWLVAPSETAAARAATPWERAALARSEEQRLAPAALERWGVAMLVAAGASHEAAEATARALVDANERGVDSHGIVFLHFYLPRLRSGITRGDAEPEVLIDLPALALVDGHAGLGAYIATFAMNLCCDKALAVGAAAVAVRNSGHFAAASSYTELAARRGCIGLLVSNSDPGMAPLGALAPILGTNPVAVAAPAAPGVPLPSLDMATSVVAQSKVILASRAGESIPEEWAIGSDGAPTDDPDDALANSVLPMAGYKGFGLAFMVDVLAGCLPRARISPEIEEGTDIDDPQQTGHCFIAVHVDALGDRATYEELLGRLADAVHSAPRADWADTFITPGEREAATRAERATGIPFTASVADLLVALGAEYGIPFPV